MCVAARSTPWATLFHAHMLSRPWQQRDRHLPWWLQGHRLWYRQPLPPFQRKGWL